MEQSVAFPGSLPGIVAWERVRSRSAGEAEEAEIAGALRAFYVGLTPGARVGDIAWQALRRVVDSGAAEEWLDFLVTFEWSLGASQPAAMPTLIQEELIAAGLADPANAKERYVRLFAHVLRLLTIDGEKRLTRQGLSETLACAVDSTTHARITAVVSRVAVLERRVDSVEHRVSDIEDFQRQLVAPARAAARERAQETDANFAGLASVIGGGQNTSVAFGPIAAEIDLPVGPSRQFERPAVVGELRQAVDSGWLAIYGDTGSGKTQLARVLATSTSSHLWLRLTDLPAAVASATVRRALESHAHPDAAHLRNSLFRDVFDGTPPIALIVLDDLPRVDGRSPFADDLITLATCAAEAGALVVSTSLYHLPDTISGGYSGCVREVTAPPLTETEVVAALEVNDAPNSIAGPLAPVVHTLSEGHAALVVAIAQYLRRRSWTITSEELVRLVTGKHAAGTRSELFARLLSSVIDEASRQLLYRMMLAVGELTLDEVRGLADVPPRIDRPLERLWELEGLWVQIDGDRHIRVPPIVRVLRGRNLSVDVERFSYAQLAFIRIRRGSLSPLDVIKIVTYLLSAGLDTQAGLVLSQGFMELERLGPIPDAGLSDFFATWPLPTSMPAGIKLFVRGTQLGMRLRWRKDVSFMLADIDAISSGTTDPFEQSAIMIATAKLLTNDPTDAWRAFPLLRRAISAHDDGLRLNLPVVPIPDSMWAESIFLAGYSVGTAEGLRELQQTVEGLSAARRRLLDGLPDLEQMFVSIPGSFFLAEHAKAEEERNWSGVVDAMERLASWAVDVGWPLLHAHAVRIVVIVLGEYIQNIDDVIARGRAAVEQNRDDQSRGVIEAAVGRQLNLKNQWTAAREWYETALSRQPTTIPLLKFDALIGAANAEQDFSLPRSIAYLQSAVAVADANDDLIGAPGQFSARAELAVAYVLNDDREQALSLWDDVGMMLVRSEPPDDTARGGIRMFLHHSAYFYCAAAPVMLLGPADRRPPTPLIGQFHAELRTYGSQVETSWRARILVMLGKIAEVRDKTDHARERGIRARMALDDSADVPPALRAEAERLASL
jgi:hypothetical protein